MVEPGTAPSCVECRDPARRAEAQGIAARLGLPVCSVPPPGDGLLLRLTTARLELALLGPGAPGAVYVDFTGGRARQRQRAAGARRELIARAVGLKPGYRPFVIDATAGLGRDAWVLAGMGMEVVMLERSRVLVELLADGLRRAGGCAGTAPNLARLILEHVEAEEHLRASLAGRRPQVVYLDPMYPARRGAPGVRKESLVLQTLLGHGDDGGVPLEAALLAAERRVVVKRPRRAPPLPGPEPSLRYEGSSTRFDVYLGAG